MTATYNFTLQQGSDKTLGFVIKNVISSRCTKVFKRVPLKGYTAALQIRKKAEDPLANLTYTSTNNGLSVDEDYGRILVHFKHIDTSKLTAGTYVYDLEISRSDLDRVYRVLEGKITVTSEVTRIE